MERGEALAQARSLFWKGEGDEAIRRLGTLPPDSDVLALRAAIRYYQGDRARSQEDADLALGLDPRSTEARLVRARLLEPRDPAAAIAEASRILEIEPRHAPAAYWRGLWRAACGDPGGSKEDLALASGVPGDDVRTCQYRGLARLTSGNLDGAIQDFDRALELGMTLPGLFWARAQAKSRKKDRRGAIEDLGRALSSGPPSAALYIERGRERLSGGDRAGAILDFDQAIALDPGSTGALYLRGKARQPSDRLEAQRDFVRACATDPADADGFFYRGLAKEEAERYGEVAPDLARALELAPYFHPRRKEFEKKAKARPKRRARSILDRDYRPWASYVVAAACVAVWVLQGDFLSTPDGLVLLERGAVSRGEVWNGEYWRLFTAMFLHIGMIHLVWNLYGGMSWCVAVERTIGPWKFLGAYLLSGLFASATSVLCHNVVSAGASGALFGMIGSVLSFYYVNLGSWRRFFGHPEVRSILTQIAVWTAIGLTALNMDNYAHFGGLVAGGLMGWLFFGAARLPLPRRVAAWGVVLGLLAFVIVGACIPGAAGAASPWGGVQGWNPWPSRAMAEEAFQESEELIREAPQEPDGYFRRGMALLGLGRKDEALENLRKADGLMEEGDERRKGVRRMIHYLESWKKKEPKSKEGGGSP